ncbi:MULTISPECIES: 30S ribosomal protein S3 [unclassified Mycoplasma]|uniref:30S ribosomal protein S3 n=1 Tax=unclassified Mycoplasma TaxID=2683645 RepID=UPI000FDE25A2
MGQKVNPNGFRFGITKPHNVKWFANKKDYVKNLVEDQRIHRFFDRQVRTYKIGQVEILRTQTNQIIVRIHTATPAIVIGSNGDNLKKIHTDLVKYLKNRALKISLDVQEIERPELSARLVAEDIATKLENRSSFRAVQKFAIRQALRNGALGIKTSVAGRLNGVDMARTEGYAEGEMKLHTLRQDVDYATANANTTYGTIGVKVWISKRAPWLGGARNVATQEN